MKIVCIGIQRQCKTYSNNRLRTLIKFNNVTIIIVIAHMCRMSLLIKKLVYIKLIFIQRQIKKYY